MVMSQHVLNDQGNVLTYQIFCRLTKDEHQSAAESSKRDNFDLIIKSKLGYSMTPPPKPISLDEPAVRTQKSILDADSFTNFGEYLNAELILAKRRGRDGSCKSNQKVPRT